MTLSVQDLYKASLKAHCVPWHLVLRPTIAYAAAIGMTTNTTSNFSCACIVLALVAVRQDCQPRPNSQQTLRWFSQQLSFSAFLHDCKYVLRDALKCISQPNTTFA